MPPFQSIDIAATAECMGVYIIIGLISQHDPLGQELLVFYLLYG